MVVLLSSEWRARCGARKQTSGALRSISDLTAVGAPILRFVKDWREIVYGALVLAMMIFRPQGLIDPSRFRRRSSLVTRAAARG